MFEEAVPSNFSQLFRDPFTQRRNATATCRSDISLSLFAAPQKSGASIVNLSLFVQC